MNRRTEFYLWPRRCSSRSECEICERKHVVLCGGSDGGDGGVALSRACTAVRLDARLLACAVFRSRPATCARRITRTGADGRGGTTRYGTGHRSRETSRNCAQYTYIIETHVVQLRVRTNAVVLPPSTTVLPVPFRARRDDNIFARQTIKTKNRRPDKPHLG